MVLTRPFEHSLQNYRGPGEAARDSRRTSLPQTYEHQGVCCLGLEGVLFLQSALQGFSVQSVD